MATSVDVPTQNGLPPAAPAAPAAAVGRRDWLKAAMAASAVVAGVAAVARAEAQELAAAEPQPSSPTKAEAAGTDVGTDAMKADAVSILVQCGSMQGDTTIGNFKDCIPAQHCSFSSSAQKSGKSNGGAGKVGKLTIEQSPVSVEIRAGKWLAELQQACYDQTPIGDVVLWQLGAFTEKGAEVQQTLTLTNAVVTSVQQAWDNGDGARSASVSFSFDKILFKIGTKPADFTLRNITDKAV